MITPSGEVSPRGRALVPGVVERKIPKMLTAPTWRKQRDIFDIFIYYVHYIDIYIDISYIYIYLRIIWRCLDLEDLENAWFV